MADDTSDPDHAGLPDYELPDALEFSRPEQYRALFENTRLQIVSALSERAATTSELAEMLEKPKGTVGHHLKVLTDAGLVHVVRTKKVRALEAKYYGRTARVFWYHRIAEGAGADERAIGTAATELAQVPAQQRHEVFANIRYARIPTERAEAFSNRLQDLLLEFADEPRAGQTTYALAAALYPTTRRPLTDDSAASGTQERAGTPTSIADAG
ncbi:ArsR/SmtB family transcription factor [Pseudactinotalea sp. Z1739]|uniref:ArsR/SmtB family transcription factor n=1 Tax=Pseudactinotalea sp. Z1739 TaxID=3413028 RepID=UPI003C7CFC75